MAIVSAYSIPHECSMWRHGSIFLFRHFSEAMLALFNLVIEVYSTGWFHPLFLGLCRPFVGAIVAFPISFSSCDDLDLPFCLCRSAWGIPCQIGPASGDFRFMHYWSAMKFHWLSVLALAPVLL